MAIWIFLAALWGQLFWAVHYHWSDATYYDYGWLVPPIVAWFLVRRWRLEKMDSDLIAPSKRLPSRHVQWTVLATILILLLLLWPIRVAERFDVYWRLPLWAHAFTIMGITHLSLGSRFGPRFSLAVAPVTIYALTAVPLPSSIEQPIIGQFTVALTELSVPIARFQGLPVELSGTALIADGQVLDIDDGCSGIRSFQSLAMSALLCGELFLLSFFARAGLLLIGAGLAFIFNALRTTTLTWIFFEHGRESFVRFHDSVGMTTFCASALTLLGIAWWLNRLETRRGTL